MMNSKRLPLPAVACVALALLAADGCSGLKGSEESGGDIYLATTNNCNCSVYVWQDPHSRVRYEVKAKYAIADEFSTRIELGVRNEGNADVNLDDAYFRIDSRNVPFRYNNMMLPLSGGKTIGPRSEQTFDLVGTAKAQVPSLWHLVAGEQLTLTVTGLRIGGKQLDQFVVTFIPRNPKLH
jgi:hypothetical protein